MRTVANRTVLIHRQTIFVSVFWTPAQKVANRGVQNFKVLAAKIAGHMGALKRKSSITSKTEADRSIKRTQFRSKVRTDHARRKWERNSRRGTEYVGKGWRCEDNVKISKDPPNTTLVWVVFGLPFHGEASNCPPDNDVGPVLLFPRGSSRFPNSPSAREICFRNARRLLRAMLRTTIWNHRTVQVAQEFPWMFGTVHCMHSISQHGPS